MMLFAAYASLVLFVAGANCQTVGQLTCFGEFFSNPDNSAQLSQISNDCGGLALSPGNLPLVCQMDRSGLCYNGIATIFNDCGNVDFADRCRVITIPIPNNAQASCLANPNNNDEILSTCGNVQLTTVEQLDSVCNSPDCRRVLDRISDDCGFEFLDMACGSIGVYSVPSLILLSVLLTSLF